MYLYECVAWTCIVLRCVLNGPCVPCPKMGFFVARRKYLWVQTETVEKVSCPGFGDAKKHQSRQALVAALLLLLLLLLLLAVWLRLRLLCVSVVAECVCLPPARRP